MNMNNNTQQMEEEPGCGCAAAESILERGAEVYEKARDAVSEAYDKTAQGVSKTIEQAKGYSSENPGKTILIALGIGVGVGLLLGARSHHSHAGRFARPLVNALSDIALGFLR